MPRRSARRSFARFHPRLSSVEKTGIGERRDWLSLSRAGSDAAFVAAGEIPRLGLDGRDSNGPKRVQQREVRFRL